MPGKIARQGNTVYLFVGNTWYHYNILDTPLGSGAMGTVYLGRDVNDHHHVVAIKLVNPEYARNRSVRERAYLEGSMAFSHPNMVEMLGCCSDGTIDGPLYIISNFVKGETIDKYICNHLHTNLDRSKRICELLYPVMDALAYLHTKNIVHLDIKPSNIMVENGSNVRLMDLGISYTGETLNNSYTGLLGTAGYAAPEQYLEKNRRAKITPATDIYALGMTLYELLSNKKISNNKIESIQNVDDRILDVIRKATHKDAIRRYQTIDEMKRELEKALSCQDKQPSKLYIITVAVFIITFVIILYILI